MCKSIANSYYVLSSCMGIYGFSRGWRCQDNDLYGNKTFLGILNGICYMAPVYNVFPMMRTINRLQIDYQNLDKTKYKEQYTEICGGICNDTF
jgi:hypothetical protein